MSRPASVSLLALLLLANACQDGKKSGDALVPVKPARPEAVRLALPVSGGTREVSVELALTESERALGLMNRTHLDPDAGMLFIFPDDEPRNFWMRNTLLPLDILFLDADGTVQNISAAQPFVEKPGYHSARSARMVLELNQGWCASHGLVPGALIPVPPELLGLATRQ